MQQLKDYEKEYIKARIENHVRVKVDAIKTRALPVTTKMGGPYQRNVHADAISLGIEIAISWDGRSRLLRVDRAKMSGDIDSIAEACIAEIKRSLIKEFIMKEDL